LTFIMGPKKRVPFKQSQQVNIDHFLEAICLSISIEFISIQAQVKLLLFILTGLCYVGPLDLLRGSLLFCVTRLEDLSS
jgi:hypothetical protein